MNKQEERLINTLSVLVSILESRGAASSTHSLYVERLADTFYDELPASYHLKLDKGDLRLAALLHDVGQSCIPAGTLGKAGKLTDAEKEKLKLHPEVSTALLKNVGGYNKILSGIKYHHERIDGKGYYGLKGKKIPVISRILAILDTFLSVVTRKSYKPSRTYDDAIATLRLGMGSQFDAELVEIFCAIPKSRIKECFEDAENSFKMIKDIGINL